MAREKSELKSILGKSKDVMFTLIEGCEDKGGDGSEIFRIATDRKLRDQVVGLLVGQRVGDTHRVTVDRDKKLSAMIEAGRYDWTNSDITDKHFPVESSGTVDVDIDLVHYGRDMSTDAVLKDLDARGFRAAKLDELLAFGAKYPDKQREFPIVALGSVWQRLDGYRYCACLYGNASERRLGLDWLGDGWDSDYRVAAVRK